ncbi:MAG: hypothetical protein ACI4GD_00650 [Lachnospiraceae bacterium]
MAKTVVSKEIKDTIEVTIQEVFTKLNSISWLERQKAMKEEAFKNTEKILYCYNALKEHVSSEENYIKEYQEEWNKKKSKSIVIYTSKSLQADEDELLEDRRLSYKRSKNDVDRITKALDKIKEYKGYDVIELRYLSRKENNEVFTYEEIAEMLAGTKGYGINLTERTVRRYKNELVKELAVLLFGSDAL